MFDATARIPSPKTSRRAADAPDNPQDDKTGQLRIPAQADARRPGPVPRILVIDDDPEVRSVAHALLERDGFETMTARNGVEGLALADRFPPPSSSAT